MSFKDETGPVTPKEAREIADRFNESHWRGVGRPGGRETARYSIPANPRRDDDIRLIVFIDHVEALVAAAELALIATGELSVDSGHPLCTAHFALRTAIANLTGEPR